MFYAAPLVGLGLHGVRIILDAYQSLSLVAVGSGEPAPCLVLYCLVLLLVLVRLQTKGDVNTTYALKLKIVVVQVSKCTSTCMLWQDIRRLTKWKRPPRATSSSALKNKLLTRNMGYIHIAAAMTPCLVSRT